MSLLPSYAAAQFPAPCPVMGYVLQPYTLGHELLLGHIACPLLEEGECQLGDFLLALEILRLPWRVAERRMHSRWWRAYWVFRGIMTHYAVGTAWLPIANRDLRHWLASQRSGPNFTVQVGGRKSQLPFLQILKLALIQAGRSPDQVMDLTYKQAIWDYIALREMNDGAIRMEVAAEADPLLAAFKRFFPDKQPLKPGGAQ